MVSDRVMQQWLLQLVLGLVAGISTYHLDFMGLNVVRCFSGDGPRARQVWRASVRKPSSHFVEDGEAARGDLPGVEEVLDRDVPLVCLQDRHWLCG